jgi:predicted peptidase
MKIKSRFTNIFILLPLFFLSACGPGQVSDPTPTNLPNPTLVPASDGMQTVVGEEKGVFLKKIFTSQSSGSIPYQFLIPENSSEDKQYPLLVFLHGAGELGNDNSSQLVSFPRHFITGQNKQDYPAFIIAPQCPVTDAWASFPGYPSSARTSSEPTNATRLTLELIDELLLKYNIDKHRVYVTGISLGGEGTFDIVSRRPDLFAAAVPICGIADVERASSVKAVAFWVFHGEMDEINPVKYSRLMVQALKDEGASPKYTEYPGAGHSIWDRAYNEPGLFPWLFSQQKP